MNNGYDCCDDTNIGPGKKYNSIVEQEEAKQGKYENPVPQMPLISKTPYVNLPKGPDPKPFNLK